MIDLALPFLKAQDYVGTIAVILLSIISNLIQQKRLRKKLISVELHPIAYKLEYYRLELIPKLPIEAKKEEFRELLKLKYLVWQNVLEEFLMCIKKKKYISHSSFERDFYNLHQTGLQNCRESWIRGGIHEVIIKKFEEWHSSESRSIEQLISSVADSEFYSSYEEKAAAILDAYLAAFTRTILSAERGLNQINGDLDDILYRDGGFIKYREALRGGNNAKI